MDSPGLGAVKVEFADDAYMVFRGVEEMLEEVLLGDKVDLTAATVVVCWMLVVVGVEVLLLSEDDITGGAGKASSGIDSVEVGLTVRHI